MPTLPTPTRQFDIRDERGVPLIDPNTGDPMQQKTADDMGSDFKRKMQDRNSFNEKLARETQTKD